MANFVPDAVRNKVWSSAVDDLTAVTVKGMFIDHADDTPTVTDDFIDDILSAARVPAIASCPTLGSKTNGVVGVGIFDGADMVFSALSGDASESLILFNDTGTESTSDILVRWDTATGLPLTPNGADVTAQWAAGGILAA